MWVYFHVSESMALCASQPQSAVLSLGPGALGVLQGFPTNMQNIYISLLFHWLDVRPVRECTRMTLQFIGFTFFTVNLLISRTDSSGIPKSDQRGIPETKSD